MTEKPQSEKPEDREVLIFRSNINDKPSAREVIFQLELMREIYQVNVDLEDREKVLRVVCSPRITVIDIRYRLLELGFDCIEMES